VFFLAYDISVFRISWKVSSSCPSIPSRVYCVLSSYCMYVHFMTRRYALAGFSTVEIDAPFIGYVREDHQAGTRKMEVRQKA